jgi:hypothetical protein
MENLSRNKQEFIMKEYEVIVVGGGISGSVAALAAARQGCKTLLIEQNGFLGGMLTAAGVGPMMTFHAGNKQIIKGIPGELIDRLVKKGKSPGHVLDTTGYTYTVTPFDSEAMKQELEIMLSESGCNILYHTMLAKVAVTGHTIKSITVCNKSGLNELKSSVYIDATGDGDLSAWAGVKYTKGRDLDGLCQPATMCMKVSNVDVAKLKAYVVENPHEFPEINDDITIIDKSERLCLTGFTDTVKKARETKILNFDREKLGLFETNNPGEFIVNTSRILGVDSTNPISLSNAEIEGRRQARGLERMLKTMIPGFEHATVIQTGPSIGIRTSRQIVGKYTLTLEDLLDSRSFDDTIAHSGYRVDIHPPDGNLKNKKEYKQMKNGKVQSIPYRCLVNDEIENLITVGRPVSATFEAVGAIRTSPTVAAIGEAGGTAASLALHVDGNFSKVDVVKLQDVLRSNNVFL